MTINTEIKATRRISFSVLQSKQFTLREKVIQSWHNSLANGRDLAELIMSHPLFAEKFETALLVVLRSRSANSHLKEEVGQDALRTIYQYFLANGADEYTDWGEDEFGGWLFALCRRHILWAAQRQRRQRATVSGNQEMFAEMSSTCDSVSEQQYERAHQLVIETIHQLHEPLQGVMQDALNGVKCQASADARGLSKNYVAILRTKGKEMLRQVLAEQMVPLMA